MSSFRSLRAKRSNLEVASDEKRDCRALWARNDDDNFKMLKGHSKAMTGFTLIEVMVALAVLAVILGASLQAVTACLGAGKTARSVCSAAAAGQEALAGIFLRQWDASPQGDERAQYKYNAVSEELSKYVKRYFITIQWRQAQMQKEAGIMTLVATQNPG